MLVFCGVELSRTGRECRVFVRVSRLWDIMPTLKRMRSHLALVLWCLACAAVIWVAPCRAEDPEPAESIPLRQSDAPEESEVVPDGETQRVKEPEATAEPQSRAEPTTVKVHIESGARVQLERVTPDGKWEVVCTSPCDEEISTEETYRINARGKVASSTFRLQATSGGSTSLEVDSASSTLRTVGSTAVIVGALPASGAAVLFVGGAIVIGVVVILACPFVAALGGSFGNCAGVLFGESGSAYWDFISQTPVWGTIVGGVALGGGGLVLLGTNRRTRVKQAGTDLALFQEPRPAQLPLPEVVSFPLLSAEF